jgi:hypothetical protein
MIFVDMDHLQFYQPRSAVVLPFSQQIVPAIEERLVAALQHRNGDELLGTSRETLREETSRDVTAATKRISPSFHPTITSNKHRKF